MSNKDWLVLLAGIKGWGAASVAPLFVTAFFIGAKRSAMHSWLLWVWLGIIAVFGVFGLMMYSILKDAFRPDTSTFPEGKIAVAGAVVTHVICAYLILRTQLRGEGDAWHKERGFEVVIGTSPTSRSRSLTDGS